MTNTENIQCIQTMVHGYDEACNVLKIETLSTFTISEKFDGKSQPILQGQNREF